MLGSERLVFLFFAGVLSVGSLPDSFAADASEGSVASLDTPARSGEIKLIDFIDPGYFLAEFEGKQLKLPFHYKTFDYSDLKEITFPTLALFELGNQGQVITIENKIAGLVLGTKLIDLQNEICEDAADSIRALGACILQEREALKGQFAATKNFVLGMDIDPDLKDMVREHSLNTYNQLVFTEEMLAKLNADFPGGTSSGLSQGSMLNSIYSTALRPLENIIESVF